MAGASLRAMPLAPSLRGAARAADAVAKATTADARRPLCLLLLPRPLEGFILRDQAEDLLRAARRASPSTRRACATARSGGCREPLADRIGATQAAPARALDPPPRRTHRGGRDLPPAAVPAGARDARLRGRLRALVRALGSLRARLRRRPEAARAPGRAARAGRAAQRADVRLLDRARAPGARGRARGDARPAGGGLVPGARPGRSRSSPSRSGTSAGAPTGRCCARSPSACPSWCCCSSAPGTTTSARRRRLRRRAVPRPTSSGSARAATRRRRA